MGKKKSFGESLEAFFAGKGFYIVLFLCVAVIGVSAWTMLTDKGTDVENSGKLDMSLSEQNGPEQQEDAALTSKTDDSIINEPAAVREQEEIQTAAEPDNGGKTGGDAPGEETKSAPAVIPEEETGSASAPQPDFFIWPVTGDIENGYSMTALQYNRTMKDWRTHDGLDISAELGAQVKAVTGGTVSAVFDDDMYGTTVVIDHKNGLSSTYSNLAAMPTVKAGDSVVTGQVIGSVGDTALCEVGEVTHLHFSMAIDGESVDPLEYMP